jgi:glycosyltransferase involved in cell wall biosynthesis
MNVVLFVARYAPDVGGVQKYVHQLARALLALGHDVQVVTGATRPDQPERDEHEGVPVLRFPACRSPLRARWWLLRNADVLRRADVIQVSETYMLEYLWRMLGPLIDRSKVFLLRHGMSLIHPVPSWERRRAHRSLKLAAGFIHDGAFISRWLGVPADLCPDQGLSPPADEIEQVPEPPPTSAVFIGRLEPDTGIRTYVDAVPQLSARLGQPFTLHVHGRGSMEGELRDRVLREGLPVHFHGEAPDAQEHIASACFAFLDGRMAIQEAHARQRLVVAAYDNPLKRDYLCEERFSPHLIAVGSAAELVEQVLRMIAHPEESRSRVAAAFEHARSLSWERTASVIASFWRERLDFPVTRPSRWAMARYSWSLNREPLGSRSLPRFE